MIKNSVVLIEFGGSHDECILLQLEALNAVQAFLVLVTNQHLLDRNPIWNSLVNEIIILEPNGKAISDFIKMKSLVRRLSLLKIDKVVFNTAQGGHVRNLALLLPKKMKTYGIVHTLRKFNGSFTQKIIHRSIKRYAVLSDDLLLKVKPTKGIHVSSFYPIAFTSFSETIEKEAHSIWITIPGGVENRRKDLKSVINFIVQTPEHVRFLFLGKSDFNRADAQLFREELIFRKILHRVELFDHFIPQSTIDSVLKKTDFLMPLIHPETPSSEQYITNQISGSFNLAYAYRIPLLIDEYFNTENDLQIAGLFYRIEKFANDFQMALKNRSICIERIENETKWKKEEQIKRYLAFIEL